MRLLSYSKATTNLLYLSAWWRRNVCVRSYHIADAGDPGSAGSPDADGGVDDLDGDEGSGDGADAGAAEEAALGGQPDQPASHRSKKQSSCTHTNTSMLINIHSYHHSFPVQDSGFKIEQKKTRQMSHSEKHCSEKRSCGFKLCKNPFCTYMTKQY